MEEKIIGYTSDTAKENAKLQIEKTCINLLVNIVKIFYNASLNKFKINREVNQIIKYIKKSSGIATNAKINNPDSSSDNLAEVEINQVIMMLENKLIKDEEPQAEDNHSNNNISSEKILHNNNYLNIEESVNTDKNFKKISDVKNIDGKKYNKESFEAFDSEVSNKIFESLENSHLITHIFNLLNSFDLKNADSQLNITAEHSDSIENYFELFCGLISYNHHSIMNKSTSSTNKVDDKDSNNNDIANEKFEFEKILLENELKRKEFSEISLYCLINRNESIREKSALSLIKLIKICSFYERFDIAGLLFSDIFKFLIYLENSASFNKAVTNHANAALNNHTLLSESINSNLLLNKNNSKNSNSLILTELFEFFSNLFEIYFSHKNTFEKIFARYNLIFTSHLSGSNDLVSSPEEFLSKITRSLENDINKKSENYFLSVDVFIGYAKILAKVVEKNNDIKEYISENFNLIQDIMTKVLFKETSDNVLSKQNSMAIDNVNNNPVKFINPESLTDDKSNRRKNPAFRNACFKLVLSLLKNNIKNFEKFFAINILDDTNQGSAAINSQTPINGEVQQNNNYNLQKNNSSNLSNNNSVYIRNNYSKRKKNNFYSSYNNSAIKSYGHVGLKNLGCICYMNSMLQQIYMVPSFRKSILQVDDLEQPNFDNSNSFDDNFLHQLQRMFSFLQYSNRQDYNPEGFCHSFKDYEGNPTNILIQQDAQEFFSRFIDKVESSLKNTNFKYLVHSCFGGKVCSQLTCSGGCNSKLNRFEDMFFLSLDVRNMKTIYDSLDKYIAVEKIDEYNCEKCKRKVTISKRNALAELPNVLIIHLQRIFYNFETDRNEKINSRLEFPKVLNLKDYTIEELERQSFSEEKKEDNPLEKQEAGVDDNENNIADGNDVNDSEHKESINKNQNAKKKNEYAYENEEIYFKSDEYYEYHLVGVNIHIGSADAGHYFSYINNLRNGKENTLSWDNMEENQKDNWLKFNDSYISKFK